MIEDFLTANEARAMDNIESLDGEQQIFAINRAIVAATSKRLRRIDNLFGVHGLGRIDEDTKSSIVADLESKGYRVEA
jgi:hypothetical protein